MILWRIVFNGSVRFLKEEESPTFLEYGLLIALIAIIVMVAVTTFGGSVSELFDEGKNAFPP